VPPCVPQTESHLNLLIEHYERTIASLKQEAHLWQARCEEVQRMYNEREEQMTEAKAVLKILTFIKPGECPSVSQMAAPIPRCA
jgi:hypothetical protein